jgi:nitrate reductase beta subunit
MPPHKAKATTAEPLADPRRMTTRARNADVHPGAKAKDALRVYRRQEEIQKEKDIQAAKKIAKEQQKEMENNIADEIAEFEDQAAIAAAHADAQFPTHQIGM